MSLNLIVEAFKAKTGSPLRKLILIKLADHANDDGMCWPSYQHIADQCEVSRTTVKNHIRELEKDGYLIREFRKDGKMNHSNMFHLTISKGGANKVVGQEMPEGGAGDALGGGAAGAPRISNYNNQSLETVSKCANAAQHAPKKQKSKMTASDLILEFGVSEQIANEYLVVRGKAPLTPTALKLIINEAEKIGWSLQQALTACCENSWRGFRADWIKNQKQRFSSQNKEGFKTAQASIDRLNDTSWAK